MNAARTSGRLDELIAATEAALRLEMGEATSCEIHKDGRVTGGMKYLEGKLVALTRIRRLVAGAGADDVADEVTSWEAEWRLRSETTNPSPPWVAYATGGLDAAKQAAALLAD